MIVESSPRAAARPSPAGQPSRQLSEQLAGGAAARRRRRPITAAEVVAAVAVATGVDRRAAGSHAGLRAGRLYLLAVLEVGDPPRAGGGSGLTAVLSVLTLNFFFIAPRHRLTIAHTHDLVELIVLLIAAVVVGRLAPPPAPAGRRGREPRAAAAAAREREATLLAEVASAILAGRSLKAQLESIGARVAEATGAARAEHGGRAGAVAGPATSITVRSTPASPGLAVRVRRRAWPLAEIERHRRAPGPPDRCGDRARAGGRAGRRERGGAARRGRADRDPARDLPRPALAADRDHHGGGRRCAATRSPTPSATS